MLISCRLILQNYKKEFLIIIFIIIIISVIDATVIQLSIKECMHLTFKIRYIHINYTLPLTFICIVSGSLGSIFNRIVHPSCCTLSRNILAELPCQPLDTYTRYSNIVTFSCQHYMFVTFFHHWWKRICGFFCQKQIKFKRIQTEQNKIQQPRFFHVVLFRQKQSVIIGQLG